MIAPSPSRTPVTREDEGAHSHWQDLRSGDTRQCMRCCPSMCHCFKLLPRVAPQCLVGLRLNPWPSGARQQAEWMWQ